METEWFTDYFCGKLMGVDQALSARLKPAGASVANYSAGPDIEITFDLPVQHVASTSIYISYDNFVTRTKLAIMSTTPCHLVQMGP
jgi:hypothetical protein